MAQAQKLAYTPRDTATAKTLPRATQIRNVQKIDRKRSINNYFTYLQTAELPQNASNDEIFNANYKKQGLQPTTGQVRPKKLEAANDENYYFDEEAAQNELNNQMLRGALAQQEHQKKLTQKAKKMRARIRATATNLSVMSWGIPLWVTVQLPVAIFSLVTFAIAGTINAFLSSTNIIVSAAAWIAEKSLAGVGLLFGFDINLIKMADELWALTYTLIIGLGFFTLMIIYFQYTMAMLRPLSGEASGLKQGMFLLALVGYSFPFLNLFPWALLWMAAVWKYPR